MKKKNISTIILVSATILVIALIVISIGLILSGDTSAVTAGDIQNEVAEMTNAESEIPGHTHNFTGTTIKAATCTEQGSTLYSCSCGRSYTLTSVATGHSWKDATCTDPKTCSNCGLTEGTALGHDATTTTTNPTCTTAGSTSTICRRCNASLGGGPIAALGHSYSTTASSYETSGTTHTPVYKCVRCDVTNKGTAVAHTGGTHDNGGKCTICTYAYQTHKMSTTASKYNTTATEHTPVYACTYSGCTNTTTGTATAHTGATHANGGKCTACSYVYQTHAKSTTIAKYDSTVTGHTPQYKCTYSGCTTTITGAEAAHEYVNGKCTICDATQASFSQCEHTYVTKYDSTSHWNECSKCAVKEADSTVKHTFTYTDNKDGKKHTVKCTACEYTATNEHQYENGVCKDCKAIDPSTCEHNYAMKSNDIQHWQECSKCNIVKENSLENHKITTATDNGNGTHTGTCTVCNTKVTENHTKGTTENCEKCSYKANSSNSGSNSNSSTNGSNSNSNGSNTDNTQSNTKLPQTGENSIVLMSAILVVGIFAGVIIVKLKKYKDVK